MKYTAPHMHSAAHKKSTRIDCRMYNTLNGTNTLSVMTSCSIFNCGKVSLLNPIRLAGTCSRYSKNAIPQLASTATISGFEPRFFKWPYQANVMKTFDATSNNTVERIGFILRCNSCDRGANGKLYLSMVDASNSGIFLTRESA